MTQMPQKLLPEKGGMGKEIHLQAEEEKKNKNGKAWCCQNSHCSWSSPEMKKILAKDLRKDISFCKDN